MAGMFADGRADSGDWLTRELAGDLFPSTTMDTLTLTAEEERFFDALGGASPGLAENLSAEYPDDKQVIMAAAKAAGLHKGGLRRTAFSMGDLSALQPPGPPSPPEGWVPPAASRAPKLESVPEGSPSFHGLDPSSPRAMSEQGPGSFPFPTSSAPSYSDFPGGMPEAAQARSRQGPSTSEPTSAAFPWPPPPCSMALPGSSGGPPSQALSSEQERMLQGFADHLLKQHSQGGSLLPPGPGGSLLPPVNGGFPQAPSLRPGPRPPGPPSMAAVGEAMRRTLGRSHSAMDLRSLGTLQRPTGPDPELHNRVGVELTTPEGHTYHVGRLSTEDRRHKILRYRQKRHERNFSKRIKYQCRKTLADSRPRVRGRFARNSDAGAVLPHDTKKAQAERAKRRHSSVDDNLLPKEDMYFAGSESMPDMGLVNADLGTAELLSSADLPPLPGYASPGQLQGDLLDPLSDAGRSPGLKYEALVGSPGEFLSLDTPKGGSLGAFGGDGDLDAAFASSATHFDQLGQWGLGQPEHMDGATSGQGKR